MIEKYKKNQQKDIAYPDDRAWYLLYGLYLSPDRQRSSDPMFLWKAKKQRILYKKNKKVWDG